jgi:hypothetical protein
MMQILINNASLSNPDYSIELVYKWGNEDWSGFFCPKSFRDFIGVENEREYLLPDFSH